MPIEYLCSQASISSYLSTSFGPLSPVDHPSAQEDDACDKHCIVLTLSQGQAGLLQGRTDLSNTNVGTDQCSTPYLRTKNQVPCRRTLPISATLRGSSSNFRDLRERASPPKGLADVVKFVYRQFAISSSRCHNFSSLNLRTTSVYL
jgi:hypothetical protein